MACRLTHGVRPARAGRFVADLPQRPVAAKLEPGILVAMALSGFCALSAEVVWTRFLTLTFGATVYSFSIILAVFLIGLGAGSSVGAALAPRLRRPAVGLAVCQALVVLAILYTAIGLADYLPMQPGTASLTENIWLTFFIDFRRALIALIPAPLLWGASFPLALAAVARSDRDPAEIVGTCTRRTRWERLPVPVYRAWRSSPGSARNARSR